MGACQLTLSWIERAKLIGHICAYIYSLMFHPEERKDTATIDIITGIGQHLIAQREPRVSLPLDTEEVDALKHLFEILQHDYVTLPSTDYSGMLLSDLAACRAIVARAERDAEKGRSMQAGQTYDIVISCRPHLVTDIAEAFQSQIEGAQGALPMRVCSVETSRKRNQGIILLEWQQGPITEHFLHDLDIDPDILDYSLHPTRSETAQHDDDPTNVGQFDGSGKISPWD